MKIDYISDLHIDSYTYDNFMTILEYYNKVFKNKQNSDILLVAGDMGHNIPQVSALFDMLKHDYKNILFCLGNHEYWYYTGRVKYKNWNDKVNELKSTLCGEQVKFMDGNIFDYNGIAIGGSSMWYDFSSAVSRDVPQEKFNSMCNCYFVDPSKMGFGGMMDCDAWFNKEKTKAVNIINDCDVYFSHVGPKEPDNIPDKFDNFTTGFFYFDGKEMMNKSKLKTWVYGHTHETISEEYVRDDGEIIKLLCNPVGYNQEKKDVGVKYFEI